MRKGFLASLIVICAGAGVALAQPAWPYAAPAAGNPYGMVPYGGYPQAPPMGWYPVRPGYGQYPSGFTGWRPPARPPVPPVGSAMPPFLAPRPNELPEATRVNAGAASDPANEPGRATAVSAEETPVNVTPAPSPALPLVAAAPAVAAVNQHLSGSPVPTGSLPAVESSPSCPTCQGDCGSCPVVEETPAAENCPAAQPACPPAEGKKVKTSIGLYGDGEYLLWWLRKGPVPVLATLGAPGGPSGIALSGDTFNTSAQEHEGMRTTLGYWFGDGQGVGAEVTYLQVFQRTTEGSVTAGPGQVLGRPFIDATTGLPSSLVVGAPGVTLAAAMPTRLWGLEGNFRAHPIHGERFNLDLIAGCRFLELDEGLFVAETAASVANLGGASLASVDGFTTHNDFFGGQIGIEPEFHWGRLFVDARAQIALGTMHEVVNIQGNTQFGSASMPGGLLAAGSNSGHFGRDQLAFIPEGDLKAGVQLTSRLRGFVGYSFLYCSSVARPGDQVDRVVNPSQLPPPVGIGALTGPAHPAFLTPRGADFWAQGMNFGMEFRY